MSERRSLLLFAAALSVVFAFATPDAARAQQGWLQAHVVKSDGDAATINSVFYDGDNVWIVGANGLITRSPDDGRDFRDLDLGLDSGLNDIFVRKNKIWIVGDAGTILLSTDSGRSFVRTLLRAENPARDRATGDSADAGPLDLYSVQFVDSEKGFIVGDDGLILASTDGGFSWSNRDSRTSSQLFHLSFRGKRGWVVGTGGLVLHTSDGGRNWYPQHSGTTADLNRVYMISDRLGLITGDGGTLLRTENGGVTWEELRIRWQEPLFGISFIDKDTGWVVGYGGRIIRTYDGGRHWVEQDSNTTNDLFSVSFQKNRGYAIGRDGVVMRYFERR